VGGGGGLCDNMELRSVQRFDKESGTPIVLYTSSRSQVLHCNSELEYVTKEMRGRRQGRHEAERERQE